MRKEAARQWRDQQIAELTGMGTTRNQQQDEQLRALRLEKEFERRAEEEAEEEEEEDQVSSYLHCNFILNVPKEVINLVLLKLVEMKS